MAAANEGAGSTSPRWLSVPEELKFLRQWAVWRWEDVPNPKTGVLEPRKMPYQAVKGPLRSAAINRPAEWRSFRECVALVEATGNTFDGIFFALQESDPYSASDFDNCIDPITHEFLPWQGQMVGYPSPEKLVKFLNSYTEITPSGTGLRVIMRGKKPGTLWSKIGGHDSGSIELYDKVRFLSFTGNHLPSTPRNIMDREAEIARMYEVVWAQKEARKAPPPGASQDTGFTGSSPVMSDSEIIFRAKRAKNGAKFSALFGGSFMSFVSQSEADQSLCNLIAFWTQDTGQIDSVFRMSGLCRDKWLKRTDYRNDTISKAIAGLRSIYKGPRRRAETSDETIDDQTVATEEDGGESVDLGDDVTQILVTAPLSDAGNAEVLALLYGDLLRHDHSRSKKGEGWMVWDDGYWRLDDDGMARRAALEAVRERKKASFTLEDDNLRKGLLKFALASENNAKQAAILQSASYMGCFSTRINDYDKDPWLAGTHNGTLDLRSGDLREPVREDLITMRLGAAYNPTAKCERWIKFLNEVFQGDHELIKYLQRAIGYSLTGDVREQKVFMLIGEGANGKSTFLTVLRALLGGYTGSAAFTTFDADRRSEASNDLARLKGKRVVTVIETNDDRKLDESRLKAVTGGDVISCRFLFSEFFEYVPTFKVFMAMNHKPIIRGTDNGIWRRIQLIEFNQTFVEQREGVTLKEGESWQDKTLESALLAELPGVLNWALVGLHDWLENGLGESQSIKNATEAYRKDSDLVGLWFQDHAQSRTDAFTRATDAYTSYAAWCKGFGYPVMSQTSFGRDLARKTFRSDKYKGQRGYWGFELIVPYDGS